MKSGLHIYIGLIFLLAFSMISGCQAKTGAVSLEPRTTNAQSMEQAKPFPKEQLPAKYSGIQPQQWGEKVTGVAYRLDTNEKVLALTFDACGGSACANGYDTKLIDYLIQKKIPATLFVSGRWIDANPDLFLKLAANDLFEIGNHGLNHLPSCVNGKSAYGIKGTGSAAEVVQEIEANARKIESLTGSLPCYYRSGTNFYDEAAVNITRDLGYQAVGYNVLGDAGATYSREQVKNALLGARAGSIVIFHFNHPEGETAEGVMEAIPGLEKNGVRFVKLSDYPLIEYP